MQKRGDGAVGGRAAEIGEKERKTPVFLRRSIEVPSKYHRSSFVTSRLHHRYCTLAARWQPAGLWLSVPEPDGGGLGRWGR
jgi:hypothetical protein